jgi:hypothetical protein
VPTVAPPLSSYRLRWPVPDFAVKSDGVGEGLPIKARELLPSLRGARVVRSELRTAACVGDGFAGQLSSSGRALEPADGARFAEHGASGQPPASMGSVTIAELWRRGQVGWPRGFPIAQFPNPPLLLAFAGWGVAALASGAAHDVGRAVFTLGLVVWALEEAVGGVNWFRRLLGVGVLVWIVVGLAGAL